MRNNIIACINYPVLNTHSMKFVRDFKKERNGVLTPSFTNDPMHAQVFGDEVDVHVNWLRETVGEELQAWSVVKQPLVSNQEFNDGKDYTNIDLVLEIHGSFETSRLYSLYKEAGYTYKQDMGGNSFTISKLEGRPVCITPMIQVVNGVRILYVESTSGVVDYTAIQHWVNKKLGREVNIINDLSRVCSEIRDICDNRAALVAS